MRAIEPMCNADVWKVACVNFGYIANWMKIDTLPPRGPRYYLCRQSTVHPLLYIEQRPSSVTRCDYSQNSTRFSCMVFVCKWNVNNIDFYAVASTPANHFRSKRIQFSQYYFVHSFIQNTDIHTHAKNSSMFINFFGGAKFVGGFPRTKQTRKKNSMMARQEWKRLPLCFFGKTNTPLDWIELSWIDGI